MVGAETCKVPYTFVCPYLCVKIYVTEIHYQNLLLAGFYLQNI
jgi:hypothetical protein